MAGLPGFWGRKSKASGHNQGFVYALRTQNRGSQAGATFLRHPGRSPLGATQGEPALLCDLGPGRHQDSDRQGGRALSVLLGQS